MVCAQPSLPQLALASHLQPPSSALQSQAFFSQLPSCAFSQLPQLSVVASGATVSVLVVESVAGVVLLLQDASANTETLNATKITNFTIFIVLNYLFHLAYFIRPRRKGTTFFIRILTLIFFIAVHFVSSCYSLESSVCFNFHLSKACLKKRCKSEIT